MPDTTTGSPKSRRRRKARSLDPHTRLGLTSQASTGERDSAHKELVGFLESAPKSLSPWAQHEIAAADDAYESLSRLGRARSRRMPSSLRRTALAAVALAVTAAVVIGVYEMGGGKSEAKSRTTGSSQKQGLSNAQKTRVAQLMVQFAAKPKNVATLVELGDIYFEAHEYNTAGGWMKRAVALEPGNTKARLALGAAAFNIGDVPGAKAAWLKVISAEPKNVEAYYDLGFLYLSKEPPDMADAKKAWAKVIALDPNSNIAKTVATHMKSLGKG
jgi:cytochrome c-type biogenesis protein CcmH/NrfG